MIIIEKKQRHQHIPANIFPQIPEWMMRTNKGERGPNHRCERSMDIMTSEPFDCFIPLINFHCPPTLEKDCVLSQTRATSDYTTTALESASQKN